MTWVDTAAWDGLEHAEEQVARALQPWKVGDAVPIFTKCAHPSEPPDAILVELKACRADAARNRQCARKEVQV